MGIEQNAFAPYSNDMTENSCFLNCQSNNQISVCRLICFKKKYAAFFRGDLDTAAQMHDLAQNYPIESGGRLVSAIVTIFIDGLIGFYFARKHGDDEKWTTVGLDAIKSLRKLAERSNWNFTNKLHLLEAEYHHLKEDHDSAMVCYQTSIREAREHRFVHEEGLAEEKFATYLLHKSKHDESMGHFINARNCYKVWGAHSLVQRVDKAISVLVPLCSKTYCPTEGP